MKYYEGILKLISEKEKGLAVLKPGPFKRNRLKGPGYRQTLADPRLGGKCTVKFAPGFVGSCYCLRIPSLRKFRLAFKKWGKCAE